MAAIQQTAILQREQQNRCPTAHKAVQCELEEKVIEIEEPKEIELEDEQSKLEREGMRMERDQEIHGLSQQIYSLILNLKTNASEIGNEYGVKIDEEEQDLNTTVANHEDTDDVDESDVPLNSMKR